MKNPEKAILIFFICLGIFLLFQAKLYGVYGSNPPEKEGYCKLMYGDKWSLSQDRTYCYSFIEGEKEIIQFTEQEFKELCPKPKLFSLQFYNKCFQAGGD